MIKTRQVKADDPQKISAILKENDKQFEADEVSTVLTTLPDFGYALS